MKPLLLCLVFALFSLHVTYAQEATPEAEGWPVVQRCIEQATEPPEDWPFEGTILMYGDYGIHAYQAGWETTRVVSFIPDNFLLPLPAGLSPDKKWYAGIEGKIINFLSLGSIFDGKTIVVFSTVDPQIVYRLPWRNSYITGSTGQYLQQPRWYDDQHLVHELPTEEPGGRSVIENLALINPFTGEFEPYHPPLFPLQANGFSLSPDWTRAIRDSENFPNLYNYETGEVITRLELDSAQFVWSADSSRFAAVTSDNTEISIFDREGALLEVVYQVEQAENTIIEPENAWSADGRYLAFVVGRDGITTLHLADTVTETILDTCVPINGYRFAWSPTASQIATTPFPRGAASNDPIYLIDVENQRWIVVAYHFTRTIFDGVIGWRAD
jgi:hypothetical protein